jgi:hypothetical protein
MRLARLTLGLACSLLLAPAPAARAAQQDAPPDYQAADSSATVVTEQNLLASERFWPYQVRIAKPWQPPGAEAALPAGTVGVLVRVETSGLARVDFGRDGRYEVPVAVTDLIERANGVRLGKVHKSFPNFLLSLGPRLVDSAGPELRVYLLSQAVRYRGFLTVFADPGAPDFPKLAEALAPLAKRSDALTILVPVCDCPDPELRERLRALGWTVPFVYDALAETYIDSLIGAETGKPALLLQTAEGRVLFQSGWREGVVPDLTAALDTAFEAQTVAAGEPGN